MFYKRNFLHVDKANEQVYICVSHKYCMLNIR